MLHFIFEFCACCNPEQTYNGLKTGMPVSASIYIFCFQLLNTVKKRLVLVGFAQNVKELDRTAQKLQQLNKYAPLRKRLYSNSPGFQEGLT